ncbi:hypothetical protein KEM52_000141 [Ascosphaera acerosa]|nr:hypothetical protein KEM52_000141 [Ascosphaera acerosa]
MADTGGWTTIESDEGVFTALIENLGVTGVQFEELVSLDPHQLRALSPVYGIIFLFKWVSSATGDQHDAPQDGTWDKDAVSNGLFFAHQRIQNACATQAILSILMNQDDRRCAEEGHGISIGKDLQDFQDFTAGYAPDIRGDALSNFEKFRVTHNAFARASPFAHEAARDPVSEEDSEAYHFIAYTPCNGQLYELDGLTPHPITHGPCTTDEFPDQVVKVLQRRISRYPAGEIRFNLMAMCRDKRLKAQEIGDVEALHAENAKRQTWAWENTLRQHNFVGFVGEILKGVTRHQLQQGGSAYDQWIDNAKRETQHRLERMAEIRASRRANK